LILLNTNVDTLRSSVGQLSDEIASY
jgi:hypothetical protein